MHYLGEVSNCSSTVAAELQRCLIIEDPEGTLFGMNIDDIDDIVHVEEDAFHETKEVQHMGDFINVAGILTHKETLVTIIKDITLEKRSA